MSAPENSRRLSSFRASLLSATSATDCRAEIVKHALLLGRTGVCFVGRLNPKLGGYIPSGTAMPGLCQMTVAPGTDE